MEQPSNSTSEYLKELLWAAFMFNLVIALVGLLVGTQFGGPWLGLRMFLGGSLAITSVLGLLVLGNFGLVWLLELRRKRKATRAGSGSASS